MNRIRESVALGMPLALMAAAFYTGRWGVLAPIILVSIAAALQAWAKSHGWAESLAKTLLVIVGTLVSLGLAFYLFVRNWVATL
jgi:ABC-type Na+ efflux pump permease subunit